MTKKIIAIFMVLVTMITMSVTASAATTADAKKKIGSYNCFISATTKSSTWTYCYMAGTDLSVGIAYNGKTIYGEAEYGLTAHVDDANWTISIKAYDYTGKLKIKSSALEKINKKYVKYTQKITFSDTKIKTKSLENGLYRFCVTFSNKKTIYLYFDKSDKYASTVRTTTSYAYAVERQLRKMNLKEIIAKQTPCTNLDVSKNYYPYDGKNHKYNGVNYKTTNDTDKWAKLAKDLCDEKWSDSHKVYTICNWLIENIAYDRYQTTVLHDARDRYYKDFSGKYSTWNTHAGVCKNFAGIFVVMCNANGIACDTIGASSLNHVWNIAYIDGQWIEIDVSRNCIYYTKDYDTSITHKYSDAYTAYNIFDTKNYETFSNDIEIGIVSPYEKHNM